ncbi:MAG: DedA family protein [Candidatus Micrarchaeaceae archaeon]
MHVLLLSLVGLFNLTYSSILSLIANYGYYALFGLLVLEEASVPVPSEVVLPVTGYFIFKGLLNPVLAFAVILAGGLVGMAIDYYIAYLIGKDVVYKHLGLFHIKKESLEAFDSWFRNNGSFAVFVTRMMPVLRGIINFPAGFALMPQKKFYAYSTFGAAIWDVLLMGFGFYLSKYAFSLQSAYGTLAALGAAVGVFIVLLFAIYKYAMKRIGKR